MNTSLLNINRQISSTGQISVIHFKKLFFHEKGNLRVTIENGNIIQKRLKILEDMKKMEFLTELLKNKEGALMKKGIMITAAAFIMGISGICYGDGQYEIDGYRIEISAHQSGNKLKIRGRVSDGETCNDLVIRAAFRSKKGKSVSATFHVKNIGPGKSDLLRKDIILSKGNNPSETYSVENVTAKCR